MAGEPELVLCRSRTLKIAESPGVGAKRWLRGTLERRHDIELVEEDPARADVCFFLAGDASGTQAASQLRELGLELPDHPEGYALATVPRKEPAARVLASARSPVGLLRAAATLAQLLHPQTAQVQVPRCALLDQPSVPLRVLGGWGLCRAHRLREAIDLASAVKANRVLYNAWGWTPAEDLNPEDAYVARYARERGVELIFELRRMSFGEAYRVSDATCREQIIDVYRRAAEAGFRSFGFLFDDVAWETVDEECDLVLEIYRSLGERLGEAPELFCCPRYYWYPGQMSLSWKGEADPHETSEQRAYLEAYGRRLPREIHIYLANFWADFPREYQDDLESRYSELLRREPVFFDNQLVNDYRLGALFPFALKGRPPDFGDHFAGYVLNSPRPVEAHAPGIATALAYAWNPAGYEPDGALGAAVLQEHGDRAPSVVRALNRLRDLANEWADGRTTATDHYRTIWEQLKSGKAGAGDVQRWRDEMETLGEDWLAALGDPSGGAEAPGSLLAALASHRRLQSDLELFEAYVEARKSKALGGPAADELRRVYRRVRRRALRHVAEILPPLQNLEPLVEALDGTSGERDLPRAESQGWSWVEYFYNNTRRRLEEIQREMLQVLGE